MTTGGADAGEGAASRLPPDWRNLAPLLDELLDLPPEARAARVAALASGDSVRRVALEGLLAEADRALPLLDAPAARVFDRLAAEGADDGAPALPEILGERYRTGRELGRGGMARVYLAHDLKHGRDVAVKVIRPDLSATLGHDRFLREIEIAARLRHPNIVPLYDSGDAAGSLYFVMPYEEGPSLRERLELHGALPVPEAVGVLRDVARALAYAHEHGVVHRDVKPDNVMLSGGAAVVTDFGIAKAVSVALTHAPDTTITQAGTVIGTPAYMAPEQATGDAATDHRADIYSFGCLGYELLTGSPPFQAQAPHSMVAAHLSEVPRPVTDLRPETPAFLARMLARCLAKNPADRPQMARDLLVVLDGADAAGTSSPAMGERPAARGRTPRRRMAFIALAAALVAVAGYVATRPAGGAESITLAVLPFGNIAGDSTINFVSDGLAEEVASALGRVPGIVVRSRSAARMYRGQLGVDVAEVGARLKVDYLVTAVVRNDRGRWILSADLARTADATSLWGEDFRIVPEEHGAAADVVAGSLTAALRRHFPRAIGATPERAVSQRTSNNEAYRLYLGGQQRLNRRAQSVRESAEFFRGAIQQDSLFAPAHSGLSMALALFPYFEGVPAREVHDEIVTAARRALALDSSMAQPHVALGLVRQFSSDWRGAATEFETAVRKEPRNVEARVQYARHLLFRGFHSDGLGQLRAARVEDPASAVVLSWMSYAYYLDGRMDSARAESRRALENDSTNFTTLTLGALIHVDRRAAEARQLIGRAPRSPSTAYVLARTGDTASLRERVRATAQPAPAWLAETSLGYGYLGIGDTARALAALERATDAGEIWPALYGVTDPIYASVRGSARFHELLRRVGLTAPAIAPPAR